MKTFPFFNSKQQKSNDKNRFCVAKREKLSQTSTNSRARHLKIGMTLENYIPKFVYRHRRIPLP